jgi:hypothetical protein
MFIEQVDHAFETTHFSLVAQLTRLVCFLTTENTGLDASRCPTFDRNRYEGHMLFERISAFELFEVILAIVFV